jgi:hypothetical protein
MQKAFGALGCVRIGSLSRGIYINEKVIFKRGIDVGLKQINICCVKVEDFTMGWFPHQCYTGGTIKQMPDPEKYPKTNKKNIPAKLPLNVFVKKRFKDFIFINK